MGRVWAKELGATTTVLPIAVLSVEVITRMCTVLVLSVLALVTVAVEVLVTVVGPHGGRPSVVMGFMMVVPPMVMGLTVLGRATRVGEASMVVRHTLVIKPTMVGNLTVVVKPTMVVGLPVLLEYPVVVGLPMLVGPPMMSPATVAVLIIKVVLTIGMVGDESITGSIREEG